MSYVEQRLAALKAENKAKGIVTPKCKAPYRPRPFMAGENSRFAVLTKEQVKGVRNLQKQGYSTKKIWQLMGVDCCYDTIRNVMIGRTWKHV